MGNRSGKVEEESTLKTPSFYADNLHTGAAHSCLEQGCFTRRGLSEPVVARLECANCSPHWVFTEEHQFALKDGLMHRRCEMMLKEFEEMLQNDQPGVEMANGVFRTGLYHPYLAICEQWIKHQTSIKITILGEIYSGKSCIVHRWDQGEWRPDHDPVFEAGLAKRVEMPGGTEINLNIVDTTGMDEYRSMRPAWMREADAVIICAKIGSVKSMKEKIDEYMETLYREIEMDHLKDRSDDPVSWESEESIAVVLCGTQVDAAPSGFRERLEAMQQHYNVPYLECSAKSNINLECLLITAVYECWLKEMFFTKVDTR